MTDVNNINSSGINSAATTSVTQDNTTTLGQDEYLKIMLAQIQAQDPTNPEGVENMFSNIAQLNSAESMNDQLSTQIEMNDNIAQMVTSMQSLENNMTSAQALQASTIVGRSVLVPGNQVTSSTEGQGMTFAVYGQDSDLSNLSLTVKNSSGESVVTLGITGSVGSQGWAEVAWDGLDADGNAAPAGTYTLSAQSTEDGVMTQSIPTAVYDQAASVSLGRQGSESTVSLEGGSEILFSDIIKISS